MSDTKRISASSYSNTAPLIWSFLFGNHRSQAELIMDTAPARSAQLLAEDRVDAALVPVIAYQMINDATIVPGICVGAREKVRSVCLVTRGCELEDVTRVALDTSSRTSAALVKIIFQEFLDKSPVWTDAAPDIDEMLAGSDAALLIGDPSLAISSGVVESDLRAFDLAEVWRRHTGLGFIFAMWMTRRESIDIDLAGARDEGLGHVADIVANYAPQIGVEARTMTTYLTEYISYEPDASMMAGMDLYFELAEKHGLIGKRRPIEFV